MHALLVLHLALAADAAPMITLERTACFGTCAVYKLAIWEDGRVQYIGKEHVKLRGSLPGKLSAAEVEALRKVFRDAKYLDLGGGYDCFEMTDHSWANTSFRDGARHHEIRHYFGCKSKKGIEALTRLENKIDEAVHIEQWIGTAEERDKMPMVEPVDVAPARAQER
jgi:hypothetical protein